MQDFSHDIFLLLSPCIFLSHLLDSKLINPIHLFFFLCKGFIVSLGILTAMCVLSKSMLIAFGWGVPLKKHTSCPKRGTSVVKSEPLQLNLTLEKPQG